MVGKYSLEVEASSELTDSLDTYSARYLTDATYLSWAEGVKGNGVGESFTLTLHDPGTIAGFALKNGYGHLDFFSKNNRVKSFKIYVDEKYLETIAIKDSISFEQYKFSKHVEGTEFKFVIDSVYPGSQFNDTCVAEAVLLTSTVGENEFYENILFWIGTPDHGDTKYHGNSRDIKSIPDTDKILLLDYMPFDIVGYETKIATLNTASSLKLMDNLPRLDGATAMYPLYSAFVHAVYPEKKFDDSDENWRLYKWEYFPSYDLVRYDYEIPSDPDQFKSIVQCNKTSRAYRRLINGETDIIFCYEPSESEKRAAAEKGVRLNLTPIGKDAFVFLVNNKNPLDNISLNQIRDIYSGRVTNWKSITNINEPIIAYQRPENSGSQTTLQAIMGSEKLMKPPLDGEYIPSGMFAMIRKVESDYYNYNSAIGYSFLFYLTKMTGITGVKVLSIDGIAPVKQTIQDNTYPFSQTVYAVTVGNESENTRKLIDWILSAQGQELVEKTGYVPVK